MIIDGKAIAKKILEDLANQIKLYPSRPKLAAIVIGDDPATVSFALLKEKVGQQIGVDVSIHQLPATQTLNEIKNRVREIGTGVAGVFIELPVPSALPVQELLDIISPDQDVDVLTTSRSERFYSGDFSLLPPVVRALEIVLAECEVDPAGQVVSVIGQGMLVGRPISYWLEQKGVQVNRIDISTPSPELLSRQSDIVISGVGKPDLVTGGMVKDGALVIDFGYGIKDGKVAGDIQRSSVEPKAKFLTPVPGGMGPLVIAAVFDNLLKLNGSDPFN